MKIHHLTPAEALRSLLIDYTIAGNLLFGTDPIAWDVWSSSSSPLRQPCCSWKRPASGWCARVAGSNRPIPARLRALPEERIHDK
jgi:hypothetical protein